MNTGAAIYGLKCQARSVCAQLSVTDSNRFVVATCTPREENELHLLDYNEDLNDITCERTYAFPSEILDLSCASSEAHPNLLFVSYQKDNVPSSTMVRMSATDDSLEEVWHVPNKAKKVLWQPTGDMKNAVAIGEKGFVYYGLDSSCQGKEVGHFTVQDMEKMTTGCWDPHHHNEIVTAIDADLVGYDLRSCQKTFKLEKAHPPCARDIDYNPNRPYYFVSCGDDCLIKFWDYRKVAEPLKTLGGHYHWVWSVKYNRYHDQLILSCSSDNLVNLWNVSSLSSAPFGGDTDLDGKNKASSSADCLVKTFDDHEDSVYTVSWSSSDAWIFASTSYDGRVAINHVPSAEKYKILL